MPASVLHSEHEIVKQKRVCICPGGTMRLQGDGNALFSTYLLPATVPISMLISFSLFHAEPEQKKNPLKMHWF